jgi:hypothetical protein
MKIKTSIYLLTITFLILFITGCTYDIDLGVEGILKITVNKNLSADSEIDVLINSSVLNIVGIAVNPLEELRNEFENQGYKTKLYVTGHKTGLYAHKHFSNLEDLSILALNILDKEILNSGKDFTIATETTLFYDIYSIKANFDFLSHINDYNLFTKLPLASLINQFDLRFILDLPISVEAHNASRAYEDNKILEWDIVPSMNNPIELIIKIPNKDRIILAAVFGICLSLIIYLLSKKSFKKNLE